MAYRLPRSGVLEVHAEGRRTAILVLSAIFAIALAVTMMASGWPTEMWGPSLSKP